MKRFTLLHVPSRTYHNVVDTVTLTFVETRRHLRMRGVIALTYSYDWNDLFAYILTNTTSPSH